jgi:hypothetical protein
VATDPLSIVEAYLDARDAYDYEGARALLANAGFQFASPIARFDDADAFIAHAIATSGIIRQVERRKAFVDGHDVCHFLTYHIQISEKLAVPVAQWAQVIDGHIRRIETLFDATPYSDLFPDRNATDGRT